MQGDGSSQPRRHPLPRLRRNRSMGAPRAGRARRAHSQVSARLAACVPRKPIGRPRVSWNAAPR